MRKVLIVQNEIMHYRKPLFNLLAEYYDLTILHSGNSSVTNTDKYQEIIADSINIGSIHFQKRLLKESTSGEYFAIILMADLHWVLNLFVCMFNRKSKHITWGHRYSKNKLVNFVRKKWLQSANANILYSECEVDRIIADNVPKDKLFIAHNTIAINNHESGTSKRKSSLLFVGRAQKRKRVDELLKAFSDVIPLIPDSVLVEIVGDGQENEYLKRYAKELGIQERVLFHGAITEPSCLKDIFHRAYAYVSPGPVGLGVLHSFAYGVPVITYSDEYHGPERSNLINKENCFLVDDFDELKSSIVDIVTTERYKEMGDSAYLLYSKERSLNKMVIAFINAIESD